MHTQAEGVNEIFQRNFLLKKKSIIQKSCILEIKEIMQHALNVLSYKSIWEEVKLFVV